MHDRSHRAEHENALGEDSDTVMMRGASVIIGPLRSVPAGREFPGETTLYTELAKQDMIKSKYDFAVIGHDACPVVLKLTVVTRPKRTASEFVPRLQQAHTDTSALDLVVRSFGSDFVRWS